MAIGGGIYLGVRSAGNAADEIDSAVTSTAEGTATGATTTTAPQARESVRNVFLHSFRDLP